MSIAPGGQLRLPTVALRLAAAPLVAAPLAAAPLVAQDAHKDHVVAPAAAAQALTLAALHLEANLEIRALGALVVSEHVQGQPLQVQLREGKAHQHTHGIGAITFAPEVARADANAD